MINLVVVMKKERKIRQATGRLKNELICSNAYQANAQVWDLQAKQASMVCQTLMQMDRHARESTLKLVSASRGSTQVQGVRSVYQYKQA